MKRGILRMVIPVIVLTSVLVGKTYAEPLVAWSAVDWGEVDNEIDSKGNVGENINVSTGVSMEVPAATLNRLAGKNLTLALHVGDGLAVSTSGRELKPVDQDLNIMINEESDVIPKDVSQGIMDGALYGRMFAMEEKTAYGIHLNIHFSLGVEYAGKYANLYYFDEQARQMVCDGSYIINEGGMAMFSLNRGDEYILTVTEKMPSGGKTAYKVTAGDSLSRIAARNDVTVKAILAANPKIKDADMIYIGETITIVKQ